jgi:hypothetical protein
VESVVPLVRLSSVNPASSVRSLKSGVEIIRDEPVELSCQSEEYIEAMFLIFWPTDTERIHMLVATKFAVGAP